MAIARCDKHTPTGIKHDYRAYALPIGYPETAAICGKMDCEEPARVWLPRPTTLHLSAVFEYLTSARTR